MWVYPFVLPTAKQSYLVYGRQGHAADKEMERQRTTNERACMVVVPHQDPYLAMLTRIMMVHGTRADSAGTAAGCVRTIGRYCYYCIGGEWVNTTYVHSSPLPLYLHMHTPGATPIIAWLRSLTHPLVYVTLRTQASKLPA